VQRDVLCHEAFDPLPCRSGCSLFGFVGVDSPGFHVIYELVDHFLKHVSGELIEKVFLFLGGLGRPANLLEAIASF
jgi:hypothetical protein